MRVLRVQMVQRVLKFDRPWAGGFSGLMGPGGQGLWYRPLGAMSMYAAFGGPPLWCLRHHLPPASGGTTKLSYAAPPSPWCEACHTIPRSLTPPLRIVFPCHPASGGDNKAFSRLYELISAFLGPLNFLRLLNLFTEPAVKLSTFPWPCQSYAAGAGIPMLPELPGPLLPPPCPA